ncbi:uncharacterized protein LOC135501079 isoform X2 [Lineus longissimus]|uniref:uncharacterized protein LOC135501079 isoform X2 n=1 Tax=Lineus longissimus TaxID=88925 RepID=UPI00315CAFEC
MNSKLVLLTIFMIFQSQGTSAFIVLTGPASDNEDDSPSLSPPCPVNCVPVRCEVTGWADGSFMENDGKCMARKTGSSPGTISSRIYCIYTGGKLDSSHPVAGANYSTPNPIIACPIGTQTYGCSLHSHWRNWYHNAAVSAVTLPDGRTQCEVTSCPRCRVEAHCLNSSTFFLSSVRPTATSSQRELTLKQNSPAYWPDVVVTIESIESRSRIECACLDDAAL